MTFLGELCVFRSYTPDRDSRPNATTVIWRSTRASLRSLRVASGFVRLHEDHATGTQEVRADDIALEC